MPVLKSADGGVFPFDFLIGSESFYFENKP